MPNGLRLWLSRWLPIRKQSRRHRCELTGQYDGYCGACCNCTFSYHDEGEAPDDTAEPNARWIEKTYARPCAHAVAPLAREQKACGWVERCTQCRAIRTVHYGCYADANDDLPPDVVAWNVALMAEVARHDNGGPFDG